MGQKQSSIPPHLELLMNATGIDFSSLLNMGNIAELTQLVKGHESELVSFFSAIYKNANSSTTKAIIDQIKNSDSWPIVKEILPQVVQWATANQIQASDVKSVPSEQILQKLIKYFKKKDSSPDILTDSFMKPLLTPPKP